MTENELFVDNPLQIAGLYNQGLFVFADKAKTKFSYTGLGVKGILHIVFYPTSQNIPAKAITVLQKIMQALEFKGAKLTDEDYMIINASTKEGYLSIDEIVTDVNPHKIVVWTDLWNDSLQEVIFYKKQKLLNVDILRCHGIDTVVQDEERKKACWAAIREFFMD